MIETILQTSSGVASLSPAAQVAAVIMIGIVIVVYFLAINDSISIKIGGKRRKDEED